MTNFPYRVTIICPDTLMPAAKELAMVYGYSEADRNTFGDTPTYQDTAGNLYAVSSILQQKLKTIFLVLNNNFGDIL